MKYFSMFSGIGGFELGIQKAHNNQKSNKKQYPWCIGYSEIDKYAIKTYDEHYGGHKNYGDATKIKPDEIPDFDLLVGGFPCQAFSIAGKRRGLEDTRGTLFFEIARVLERKQPRMFLLENVKGLLNHDGGNTFTLILKTIDELGYDAEWQVLNSKHFGVPQNRERVFIVGHLRGKSSRQVFPIGQSSKEIDQQQSGVSFPTVFSSQHKIARGMAMIEVKPVLTPDRPNKRQNGRRFKEDGEPSFTLTGQDIHGIMKGNKIRRLTPTECERLQGFPDNWTIGSDTQRYRQCGNAVTTNVIEAIMTSIFSKRL